MASVVLMTRGPLTQTNIWKQFMASQLFFWRRRSMDMCKCGHMLKDHKDFKVSMKMEENTGGKCSNKDCKCEKFEPLDVVQRVAGALIPIQLWEYRLPFDAVPTFLAMQGTVGKSFEGKEKLRPEVNGPAWLVRKLMKLKPIPRFKEGELEKLKQEIPQFVPMDGMAVYPLGIKEDKFGPIDFKNEGRWDQEWL